VIWFVITLPFKLVSLGFKTGAGSVLLTHRLLRLISYRRIFWFGTGVGVGMLFAPGPGTELRAKLQKAIEDLQGSAGKAAGTGDLVSKVREELASSPRTWHLPQPTVTLDGEGTVVLTGDVPDAVASADLERVAAAVKGVVTVTNKLAVPAAPST
jgi:hypothetical protein